VLKVNQRPQLLLRQVSVYVHATTVVFRKWGGVSVVKKKS